MCLKKSSNESKILILLLKWFAGIFKGSPIDEHLQKILELSENPLYLKCLENNALENIFRNYFSKHAKKKNIAIDGKYLRGRVTR